MTSDRLTQHSGFKTRLEDLRRFYALLDDLAKHTGGPRSLCDCSGRMDWPQRGVYFFFEIGEVRIESGAGLRVTRVGTHGLKTGSRTTLWKRLSNHKGPQRTRAGNHRGSIFRLLVGSSLLRQTGYKCPTWGVGGSAPKKIIVGEFELERHVSHVIGQMTFLWLAVEDKAGPESLRGVIERNAISLLSNLNKPAFDGPSADWLGHHCPRHKVRQSALWNQNHADEAYDPSFLDIMDDLVRQAGDSG